MPLAYSVWFYRPGEPSPLTEVTATVAITPSDRRVGLSRHKALGPQEGMLFLNPDGPSERPETFHTGGVSFAFDIIFIRRDHKVGMIVHNVQPDDPGRWTYRKSAAVIETVGGFCKSHGVQLGDEVGFGHAVVARRRAQQPTACPGCGRPILPGDYTNPTNGQCEMCDESRAGQAQPAESDRPVKCPKCGAPNASAEKCVFCGERFAQAAGEARACWRCQGSGLCADCRQTRPDLWTGNPNCTNCRGSGKCDFCHGNGSYGAGGQEAARSAQQYNPGPGEEVITTATGRWQWMTGGQGGGTYMHLDCDCPTDQAGLCTCCRGASPAAVKTGRRAIRTVVDAGRRIAARFAQMQPISDVPSAAPANDSGGAGPDETPAGPGERAAQTPADQNCPVCKWPGYTVPGRCKSCGYSAPDPEAPPEYFAQAPQHPMAQSMPYDPADQGGPNDCTDCGKKAEVDGPDGRPLCAGCYEGRYGPLEPEGQARVHDVLRSITEASRSAWNPTPRRAQSDPIYRSQYMAAIARALQLSPDRARAKLLRMIEATEAQSAAASGITRQACDDAVEAARAALATLPIEGRLAWNPMPWEERGPTETPYGQVSCENCGFKISEEDLDGPNMPCPKCGNADPDAGWRPVEPDEPDPDRAYDEWRDREGASRYAQAILCPACNAPVGGGESCGSCGADLDAYEQAGLTASVRREAAFPAKFPGTCKSCGGTIGVGVMIGWAKDKGAWHQNCAAPGGSGGGSSRSRGRGKWTGCSCGSREDDAGDLIPSERNCSSCEFDA